MPDMPERKSLHDMLLEEGLVTREQLEAAVERKREKGGHLGQALVDMGVVDRDAILKCLARQAGMEVVDLDAMEIPEEVLRKVERATAEAYQIIPVAFHRDTLTVAMADPLAVNALDDLRFMLNCHVKGTCATEKAVRRAIERYYGPQQAS